MKYMHDAVLAGLVASTVLSTKHRKGFTMTYEDIIDAQNFLVKYWGEDGKRVIVEAQKATKCNISFKRFLDICTPCGGNLVGMILSGIRELWPDVWDAIPDDMGPFELHCLCLTLNLCGVDTSK